MSNSLDRLSSAIASRYEIERELGHGSMATVYLARDLKHNREVAVKILLADVGFALGSERFRREIDLATHLSHPHILPIYDSGDADGELYYVMPFITGESLRARLNRERQLPVDEALSITCEVAGALDYSHRHGVIHRDIKPENILLEDGHALVADFGIARAVSAVGEERLTSTSVSVGTPTYMSPEQGMADPGLDGRSDIYSLGCVLYEMLAGQPPFTGRTTQALIARHSLDEVPSLRIVRSTIPEDVEDAMLRALAKVPADRFATAAEFANVLKACDQPGAQTVRRRRRRIVKGNSATRRNRSVVAFAGAIGILAISGAAWAGKNFLWPARHKEAPNIGAAGFKPQRIAVLYFKDLSPDKRLGYLADGLTESLINQLHDVRALDVISIRGINQFRGRNVPNDSIARTFEAGTLVEGSIVPEGSRVRVTLSLVDGNSGEKFDETPVVESLANPLGLRTQLAEQLALILRQRLPDEIRLRAARTDTENPTAWSFVQRAQRLRRDADSLDQSGDTTRASNQLIAADRQLAQAEVDDSRWTEPIVLRGKIAAQQERLSRDPAEAARFINAGLAYADAAIALDARNADALELRGNLRVRPIVRGLINGDRAAVDLRASEKDLRASIAANPNQATALSTLSAIQYTHNDPVESYNLAQRAYQADAYLAEAPKLLWMLSATSYDLEHFVDAEKWCAESARRFPHHSFTVRCRLWIMTATTVRPDPVEAWRRAEDSEGAAPPPQREFYRREGQMVVADVIGRAGLLDSARRVLVRARADRTIDPRSQLVGLEAFVRAQLGDRKEAIDLLQRYLTDNPEHRSGFAKVNAWWWRNLQNDPRFKSLLAGKG